MGAEPGSGGPKALQGPIRGRKGAQPKGLFQIRHCHCPVRESNRFQPASRVFAEVTVEALGVTMAGLRVLLDQAAKACSVVPDLVSG